MKRFTVLLAIIILVLTAPVYAAVRPGTEAQYFLQSAHENMDTPIHRVRIQVGDIERVDGKPYQWWQMTLVKHDDSALGIRVLSERIPMTGTENVGDIARYIYCPVSGACLEYLNAQTNRALIPGFSYFKKDYIPAVFNDALYRDGFANSGRLIGHSLVRSNIRPDFPDLDFSQAKVLRLRDDYRLGPHTTTRDDYDESVPVGSRKSRILTREEFIEVMDAGANFLRVERENATWLREYPVFYHTLGVHPDDFYRSNFVPERSYLDEPAVRFGWSKNVSGSIMSPDIIANALQARVESYEHPRDRQMYGHSTNDPGAMEAFYDKTDVWDTYQYTTYYQMAAGAPALFFEGRYVPRGYGWVPEMLLGEGLEGLVDEQQYDFFHSFMRGAARRWGGEWGMSCYPEGDKSMMIPSMIHAYDMGAKYFYFWNDGNLPYKQWVKVIRGLKAHMDTHPRPLPSETIKSAKAAVVLPPGYILYENGIWGMRAEEVNEEGVSYADIASNALFEGILLSRDGIEYDYVNDYPGIEKAGYQQLIYVRKNGNVEWSPARRTKNAPNTLKLAVKPKEGDPISKRDPGKSDYMIPRASQVKIDADLGDWSDANWVSMKGHPQRFGDNYRTTIRFKVPDGVAKVKPPEALGFQWDSNNNNYREKFLLEGWSPDETVVTEVTPGSVADKAGLRPGDIIHNFNGRRSRWAFEVWGMINQIQGKPGTDVVLDVQRGGLDRVGGDEDLSARFAFMVDDQNLYVAVDVTDDIHKQYMPGMDWWMNDCVQVGFDPLMKHSYDYDEHCHEIGFALQNDKPLAFRWKGRKGQPVAEMSNVQVQAKRVGEHTVYEASIPLTELKPLAIDMWRRVGMSVAVNDSDDGKNRESRVELVSRSLTAGKHVELFPVFEFEPSRDESKVSATIWWNRRCLKPGGEVELVVAVASPKTTQATLAARLESLDDPNTKPVTTELTLPVTPEAKEFTLNALTLSQPGRYRLTVDIISPDGRTAASDSQPVYVYK